MSKLNIGCGKRKYTGYKTIDIESSNNPDIVGDFRTMSFSDIEEIRAEHILEHFSRDESCLVLPQWRSWLKDNGILIVETPDFEYICKEFVGKTPDVQYWLARHAYGSQEADWAFHRSEWYEYKFKKLLPDLGFDIISITRNTTRGYLPNIKVVAKKGHPKI